MQRCIALFHNRLFNIVISEDLKKFTEISKKALDKRFYSGYNEHRIC
jgi:hypothetical protein